MLGTDNLFHPSSGGKRSRMTLEDAFLHRLKQEAEREKTQPIYGCQGDVDGIFYFFLSSRKKKQKKSVFVRAANLFFFISSEQRR